MAGAISTRSSKDKTDEQAKRRSHELAHRPTQSGLHTDILALQRAVGNRAISQLLQPGTGNVPGIQTKLAVGQPRDVYEREADRVAESVAREKSALPGDDNRPRCLPSRKPGLGLKQHLNSSDPGQTLDPTLRARMENRFNHDFSQVRIHTGRDAEAVTAALGARALTSGQDIWLGEGENPQDTQVLAHELTHVVQQQGTVLGGGAVTASVPQVQLLRVLPDGQFAVALEEFTNQWRIPDRAIQLLRQSPTFGRMVGILNRRYAYWKDPRTEFEFERGVIQSGPFRNRRIIRVSQGSGRAFFSPVGSPDNPLSFDVIYITGHTIGEFVEEIAHEAAHAVEFVTRTATAPGTILAEVGNIIQEERRVRGRERTVVSEIRGRGGRRELPQPGALQDIWEIERDFPRIGENRTYLEDAFFNATMRRAIAQERLDEAAIGRIDDEVNRLAIDQSGIGRFLANPDNFWLGIIVPSRYGRLRYLRRVIHQSWATFLAAHPRGTSGFEELKEQKLQEHARALQRIGQAFFGETIAYTDRPGTRPPGRPTSARPTRQPFWQRFVSP